MKYSIRQTRYFRSTGCKAVMALAFASVIGGLSISSSALAEDDGGHGWQQNRKADKDHRKFEKHGGREGYGYGYRPVYQRPYNYAQPVYIPPPVYYEPRQSPGINLFFPLDFRR